MKLGYIDYLNCFPFYYHLFEKLSLKGVEVFSARPNELNAGMTAAALDMSPISAATCAELADEILLLPDFCLSSVGYVGSVVLISTLPIEELDGKTIALTNASHTSVVLLKTMMQKYYGARPQYKHADLIPDFDSADAVLVIGNEAMQSNIGAGRKVYDLGELWLQKSGFPIVFAAFAVRKEVAGRYAQEIRSITISFYRSLACLVTDKAGLIGYAQRKYPQIEYDLDAYYDYLKFYFTEELKDALNFFCDSAVEQGFLRKPGSFEFLDLQ